MGQLVFIGDNSNGPFTPNAIFLENLFESAGNTVDYGFEDDGEAFFSEESFTAIVAFRLMQPAAAQRQDIVYCESNEGGWSIFIDSNGEISGSVSGATVTPDTSDLPLGRVIVAALAYDSLEGGSASLYLQGRFMGSDGGAIGESGADVTFLLGPNGTWTNDLVEYLGFAFINNALDAEEMAEVFVATQDAARVTFPADITGTRAVYNAVSGLSDITLWEPTINTMSAPDLPQIETGEGSVAALKDAPMHMAHSGWAAPVIP